MRWAGLAAAAIAALAACKASDPAPQAVTRPLESAAAVLVPAGATWRPLGRSADPGPRWFEPDLDDSAWDLGLAPFGYGEGDEATVVDFGPDPAAKPIRNVYRLHFPVREPARVLALTMRVLHDDGALAYLNGQEIYRANLPPDPVTATTRATAPAPGAAFVERAVDPRLLRAGDNVLAIAVHQTAPDSPTHSFDLALAAAETIAVTRGPYLQLATPTQVTVSWRLDPPAPARLRWGPSAPTTPIDDPAATADHAVTLTGLAPGTRYRYSVGTREDVLAGGEEGFSFVTPPASGPAAPTRIWVLGDSGTADANAARVRDAYKAYAGDRATDLWLMLGDNAYPTGTDADYQRAVFDFFPDLLRTTALWPALGNTDILCCEATAATALPYLSIFTLPTNGEAGGVPSGSELYYAFDRANVHFVVLDSRLSDRTPGGPMLTWLRKDLEANDKTWLVAYWHHPPYTRGEHDSDAEYEHILMRENALPLLEAHGVDLVLSGHSHSYERSFLLDGHYGASATLTDAMKKDRGTGRPEETGAYQKPSPARGPHEGAVYVVLGSSGQLSDGTLNHPAMVVSTLSRGSLMLDVDGPELRAVFLRESGEVGDHFTIRKGARPDGGAGAADAGAADAGGAEVSGGPPPGDGCGCKLASRGAHRATGGPVALALLALLGRARRRVDGKTPPGRL